MNDTVKPPVLVTGMPRSGTTWLARLAATAPGTSLTGREPMNPRGRQYALAGTLPGWARLSSLDPKQRRGLRLAYRGLNPWVYSRYGRRQWAAAWPWTQIVVKDPFALLSVPVIVETTGARVVVVYRHPGAMLASYRRMGWRPDVAEMQPILRAHRVATGDASPEVADLPEHGTVSEPASMARFWNALYALALHDVDLSPAGREAVVVSHEELAGGGLEAGRRLFAELGLTWSQASTDELAKEAGTGSATGTQLHQFDRPPSQVATAWRATLTADEIAVVESSTERMRSRLDVARLVLG